MKTFKSFSQQMLNNTGHTILLGDKKSILGLIHLIVFSTSVIGGSVMYFYDMNSFLSLILLGLVSFLGWMVNRVGHPKSSAVILIVALLITIQFNIFSGFGIHDVAIIAWPAFIFFSGLLFGWQVIPFVTALIMLLAGLTNLIPNAQFFPNYSDTGDLIVMLLILLAFSLIAISLLRSNEHLLQHLLRSEERFQAIYNSINDAIIIHDSQTGAILDINEKMAEMFGYTRREILLLGNVSAISSGIPPYTQENALDCIKKTVAQGMQHFEWQAKDKSGRLFWVDINMKLATIANQPQVLVSLRDITERKLAELQREVLYQVHRAVSSQLDADLVVHAAVETFVGLTGYPHVCIALPDANGAHWVVRAAAGSLAAETGALYPIHQGVIGRVFKTGQTQRVCDILDDPDYVPKVSATDAPTLRCELV
ncbi:MAG: PAS domain S-box protein [Chloroflexota bacterium]